MPRQSLKTKEQEEATERLKGWLWKGATVYAMQKHRSRSGLRRTVEYLAVQPQEQGSPAGGLLFMGHNVALALGWRYDREREGVILAPGDDLVPELGRLLFGDSSALLERRI